MNTYSLASDSPRWWWLPATAGALGTAAATAILVVPATGTAPPVAPPAREVVVSPGTIVERPCYLARPGWNTVRGWEQPVCTTRLGVGRDTGPAYARRPAPDHRP
ncbi:hypothetical protein EXE59_11220 [Nocardioides eburneiflavus]|uniref:Uncharacterized protein n=1 Tax=Nocardioides eburneiflavus TaxID=2518372 RepID=A0A4Z1CMF3_9ACTN|nr:hypothetical protein [Nocardioides eburneiflavus]TGN64469.1 hypothetical protein EXE59_11220 [Nocardioides eburneiflavus]